MEFEDFGKTPRWKTVRESLLITEKIDGTNAQIYIPPDPSEPILIGSRNKWITPEQDNAGFARFVVEHGDVWRRLGPGRHYGEWYGSGIQRRYDLDHKRFALFNVRRFADGLPEGLPANVHLVPVLYQGALLGDEQIASLVEDLYTSGSVAVPGYMKPEGVVITFNGERFKITDNGDQHKGMTTTLREAVTSAAADERAKREATEAPADRARRWIKVVKSDDGTALVFVENPATNAAIGKELTERCALADIRTTRDRVAANALAKYPKAFA